LCADNDKDGLAIRKQRDSKTWDEKEIIKMGEMDKNNEMGDKDAEKRKE